ncbi:MAG: penicillin acylase family protein [Saprospiraceae bacterium]
MQVLKFSASLIATICLVLLFSWHHPFEAPLPPVGNFFSPFTGFWQNADPTKVPEAQLLQFPDLKGTVRIVFDERLVPHIFADHNTDLYFAQGYITAMHRLWQMDIATRSIGGRLSEVIGERTIETDQLQRRQGLLYAAQNALTAWQRSPTEMAALNAYVAGVNAYIATLNPRDYPLEFKLLNYKPEPWSPLKSALFFKYMAQTLCGRSDDLEATNAQALLGSTLFDFLYPEINPKQSPIIPAGTAWKFQPATIVPDTVTSDSSQLSQLIRHQALPESPEFVGSNNWAVSGKKTASGAPILCNDPHLNLTLPAIWYEIQLSTPQFNAYGVSLPGVPNIIIGFNNDIAWGVTNVGQDVLDWYKITWADEKKTKYIYDDQVREVTIIKDTIRVRGKADPVVQDIKFTVWGPVVYEDDNAPRQDMAMRWVAHDVPDAREFYDGGTFLQLMSAKNYKDYSKALEGYDSPAQNFVFASKDGDIALKVNGKFPLKRKEQGRFVQDGSRSATAWQGFIPRDQIPQVLNPDRGFVSSANQNSTDPSYPYYYNGGFDDYRGRYINRRLQEMNNITPKDMMALQNDNYSIKAEEGVAALLQVINTQSLSKVAQELLTDVKKWDFRFNKNVRAPVIFEKWWNLGYKDTFDEIFTSKDSNNILYPEAWRFFDLLITQPNNDIFYNKTTAAKENATMIITSALEKTAAELQKEYPDGRYDWAKYKDSFIGHLGRIDAFGSGKLNIGGYRDAPNAMARSHGPSWRMVVELDDQVKAWGVYPGGQSGNPGSKYYNNMLDTWVNGKYNPLFFMKDAQDKDQPILYRMEMRKE